jgi:hypothetical protein
MKALAELDNTCRWTVGFQGTGLEPGICYIPPTITNTPVPPTEKPPVFIITLRVITFQIEAPIIK